MAEYNFILFKPDKTIEYGETDRFTFPWRSYPINTIRYCKEDHEYFKFAICKTIGWETHDFNGSPLQIDDMPAWIQMALLVMP